MPILSGIVDKLKNKIIGAISQGYKLIGSPTFIAMRNKLSRALHPSDPPLFNGERHLITLTGKNYRWAGPGTQVEERMRRGGLYAQPINELDALTKQHDLDFMKKGLTPQEEQESDSRLVRGAMRLTNKIPEARLVASAISAKMLANKSGALPYGTFV
jgi:hypothetical protein